MNVIEARRIRHLVLRLDRGEELPGALLRALDELEARAGWIDGAGTLESAEIVTFDQPARRHASAHRLDRPCDVVSLHGTVALQSGASSLRLWVTLAREGDLGLELAAGELLAARVHALDLRVTAFDDAILARVPDEATGLALLAAQTSAATPPTPEPPRLIEAAPSPPLPPRPVRPQQEEEHYPEVGDLVTHFHFGECEVISSDGERIRLRQERDGRVREVALTMLRIEPPTHNAERDKRHFHLSRKN